MPFVCHVQNRHQQTADNEEHDDVREQRAARPDGGAQGFSSPIPPLAIDSSQPPLQVSEVTFEPCQITRNLALLLPAFQGLHIPA